MKTTTETLSVNGVVLNTLAKNISSITGRLRAPGYRTDNISVPGSHGDLWVPNKKYQANTITLPMWVAGCDDDGAIPTGSSARKQFFANVDALVGLFKSPDLLDVQWTKADAKVRQCWAEASDVLDFTADAAPTAMVGVVLTIPSAFWQDLVAITQAFIGDVSSVNPTKFVGGTAPTEDMVWSFAGPWTNPQITFWDGSWVRYNGTIADGNKLDIDCGEWTLTGTGFTPDYGAIEHDGADAIWAALPAMPAAVRPMVLSGSGRISTSSLTMTGRRKFLVG